MFPATITTDRFVEMGWYPTMAPTTAWPDTEAVDPVWLGQARFRPGTLRP